MITILRKLRKNIFKGNKFRNYIFYAIGEIILIVLGILIALQINNWNHRQILKNREVAYIEDIRLSLLQDLDTIEYIIAFNYEKDSCITKGIELLGSEMDNSNRASEFLQLLFTIGYFEVFRPNFVAFDNMISAESIDLIRNDSLRKSLSYYYGSKESYELGTQERIKDKTRQFLDYVMPIIVSKEIASNLIGQNLEFQYGSSKENEFYKNPRVFYELFMMKHNISDQNSELERYKSQIDELLGLIAEIQQMK